MEKGEKQKQTFAMFFGFQSIIIDKLTLAHRNTFLFQHRRSDARSWQLELTAKRLDLDMGSECIAHCWVSGVHENRGNLHLGQSEGAGPLTL